ncbi:GNAT family N-acetyltransferase [Krasilnikoviella flava]|uniref:Ribosomal protein S18 acetylase RimI n=1 Tax=Krasilnikoviella flava TaxID=526729 RepID=A0A1T5JLV8_9MICO|nr:GNAT family N-acetyltransferase [Krasilnikoviella flava]SKC52242.1 Ribosomal protein S18 acetylase RimI [Krasilnikoviella flava]
MAGWTVVRVTDPAELVAASHLFDGPVSPEGAADTLRRPGHVVLLARAADGRDVGFVSGVEMRHPDKDPEMFLYELGVDAAWRRRGVASALLAALRDVALARGCRGMWTGTEADNAAALATYRAAGAEIDDGSVFVVWDDLDAGPREATSRTDEGDAG